MESLMNDGAVLTELFARTFGRMEGIFAVRAPGRVNIIGEHTDYNGYPVLPIAIDRSIRILAAPRWDREVRIVSESAAFPPRTFRLEEIVKPGMQGDWVNYIRASVRGILESGWKDPGTCRGFDAAVSGDIPIAAGLSSSSALVVASALAFLAANGLPFNRIQLAELLAKAERFVGTEGGGMDQAISLLAEENHALKIDFFPLRIGPVRMLEGYSFVVCNSLVRSAKTENSRREFNRRAVECRLALLLITSHIEKSTGRNLSGVARLAELDRMEDGFRPEEIRQFAFAALDAHPYSLERVSASAGCEREAVARECLTLRDGSLFQPGPEGFELLRRYRHVVTEAARVERAADALAGGDVEMLGELMNASHASCRDDYEISSPELEELVALARENGALGARLTGAGFGGCTVNLLPSEHFPEFLRAMRHGYYEKNSPLRPNLEEPRSDWMFSCHPAAGATVEPYSL